MIGSNLCRLNPIFIQDTNSSQTQQFYYIITFKATCFNSIESSSGLLENRSNVSTSIVHSGIPKAYNRWYSQYKSTRVRDLYEFEEHNEITNVKLIPSVQSKPIYLFIYLLIYLFIYLFIISLFYLCPLMSCSFSQTISLLEVSQAEPFLALKCMLRAPNLIVSS